MSGTFKLKLKCLWEPVHNLSQLKENDKLPQSSSRINLKSGQSGTHLKCQDFGSWMQEDWGQSPEDHVSKTQNNKHNNFRRPSVRTPNYYSCVPNPIITPGLKIIPLWCRGTIVYPTEKWGPIRIKIWTMQRPTVSYIIIHTHLRFPNIFQKNRIAKPPSKQ